MPNYFRSVLSDKQFKDMEAFVKTVKAPASIIDTDLVSSKTFESKQAAEIGYQLMTKSQQ